MADQNDFATRTGQLIKGRSPVGHVHDDRYQLVLPITLRSSDDLDTITAPRRYRCISSAIAGNAALHYPSGAIHGFLDVIEMGTGYVEQMWVDTWNGWIALRRLYAGAWSPWVKISAAWADITGKPTTFPTAAHNHDTAYLNLDPVTLGSTQDLNAVLTARRYKTISSSIAANPALNYPSGAQHGFLDVVPMGTGYVYHRWVDTLGGWTADRRLSGGVWTPWERSGGSEEPASPPVVIQSGSRVVYGAERPDAWPSPATTYWHHPGGTTVIPPEYRGDGYVGKLAAATGYSQMLVTKAKASGTVDVSCINPTTGRHVTYRLQGPWDGTSGGMDAFQRIEETWVGAVTGGVPSPGTLVLPRSNIEWAFQIDVAGNRQFVPHHGNVTAVDAGRPRGLFRMDGTAIDLSAVAVGGTITGLDGVKHRQSVYARHPDSGTTDWVRIDQVITISPDGMLQSESTWTALHDVVVGSNYGPMTPIQVGVVDSAHVLGGGSYPIDTTPPATTRYDTLTEGKATESVLFTGPGAPFVAVAFLDPAETLLRDHPLTETSNPLRIENRSGNGLVKLYPSGFDTAVTVPAGTVWRMGAQWRYGETVDAAQYA